jgi:hypothetical protein
MLHMRLDRTICAKHRALVHALESRVLLSTYTPEVLYTFSSSQTVHAIFTSGNGSLTYVDDSGVSTETAGSAPVQRAQFSMEGIADPLGSAFENSSGDIFGTSEQPTDAIWELQSGSNSFTQLASFDPSTVGTNPAADYMDSSGNIYGTTAGSIWEYHAATRQISSATIPSSFGSVGDAIVADSAGDIFVATNGTAAAPGLFFEISAGSSTVNALATFTSDQEGNLGGLAIDSSGNIYGTTLGGASGLEIYKVSPSDLTSLTPLGTLPSSGGQLLLDSSGDIFAQGQTASGSTITETFYELPVNEHAAESIATLDNGTAGYNTYTFTLDANTGVIYGANQDGGSSGSGTLFSLTPGGSSGGPASLTTSIAKSTLPSSVVAGGSSKGRVTIDVTNTGSAIDSGRFIGALYASADGLVDGSAVEIGSVARQLSLKVGETTALTVQVKSLPTSLDETYTLLSNVIDSSENNVTSTSGPMLTATAPYIAFSETIIHSTLLASDVSGQKTKATVQIKIENGGNIASSGESTIAIYASEDRTAADGTLIRSTSETLSIKPGADRVITVPLMSIPAVPDGNYQLVAQVTDTEGDVTETVGSTYTLAAPVVSVVPSAATTLVSKSGIGLISFTLTNMGNISSTAASTIAVLASSNGTTAGATSVYSEPRTLVISPAKARVLKLKLSAAQVMSLQAATSVILEVTDVLGGIQTLALSGL